MTDPAPGHQLDHVAIGAPRIADALPFLVGELGGAACDGGPGLGFRWIQWRFAGGGVIEVLEPAGAPGGFLHRFLESRGPGVHHVTFKVPDLAAAADRARDHGYEIVGWFDAEPSWKECFLHPKQAQGVVVQLAESHPSLIPADYPDWRSWLPETDPAAEAATLRSLQLSARDAEAARRQWRDVLGGEASDLDGERIAFRWPESGLHIEVAIRPEADEGPSCIALAPGALAPGQERRVLGTCFRADEDPRGIFRRHATRS